MAVVHVVFKALVARWQCCSHWLNVWWLRFVFTGRRRVSSAGWGWIFMRLSLKLTLIPHLVSLSQTWGRRGQLETHCLGKLTVRPGATSQSDRCYCEWCCWLWTNVDAVFPQLLVWRCCPEKGRVSRSSVGPAWTSSPQSEKVRRPSLGKGFQIKTFSELLQAAHATYILLLLLHVLSFLHFSHVFCCCWELPWTMSLYRYYIKSLQ